MLFDKYPFSKNCVREALEPIKVGEPVTQNLAVSRYRAFYQIDFENRLPGLRASLGLIKSGGFDIVTHVFLHEAAKGTVFVFHGLYDHVGIYDKPIGFFLSQGYNVVAYDLPGHGVSSGQLAVVRHFYRYRQVFESVVEYFEGHIKQPWFALAQSTGAAVLIDAMLRGDVYPFKRSILLAPLVRPCNWQRNRRIHTLVSPFVDYIPRKFTINSHDQNFVSFLRHEDVLQSHYLSAHWVGALKEWIPKIEAAAPSDQDVLVIQGQEDETVDWQHNVAVLQKKFPRMSMSYLPTLRHQVVNEIESLRDEVFGLALDYIQDPSSVVCT